MLIVRDHYVNWGRSETRIHIDIVLMDAQECALTLKEAAQLLGAQGAPEIVLHPNGIVATFYRTGGEE